MLIMFQIVIIQKEAGPIILILLTTSSEVLVHVALGEGKHMAYSIHFAIY